MWVCIDCSLRQAGCVGQVDVGVLVYGFGWAVWVPCGLDQFGMSSIPRRLHVTGIINPNRLVNYI